MPISSKLFGARISTKHARVLCNAIARKNVTKAKNILNGLLDQTGNIDGKYYKSASKVFLDVLKTAEANARQKNVNVEKLFVKTVKADKAEKFIRPRTRFKFRGKKAKRTNLEIVLEER